MKKIKLLALPLLVAGFIGALSYLDKSYLDHQNLLTNPGFEAGTAAWTVTGGTATNDTVNVHGGQISVAVSVSAGTACIYQDVTPNVQMGGTNLEYSAWVKTLATDVQVCARQAGSSIGYCSAVPGSGSWVQVPVNYFGPSSGSVGVSICNIVSNTETFNVDDSYVGTARNIGTAALAPLPTRQIFLSGSGTYTLPTNPTPASITVEMAGGGAGGGGSNNGTITNGSPGGNTTFGSSLLTANGGSAGSSYSIGGVGGTATVNSPAVAIVALSGGSGQGSIYSSAPSGGFEQIGGSGGVNPFGGGGGGGGSTTNGFSAAANTGGGGGGSSNPSGVNGAVGGTGGGAGGYLKAVIANPSSTYSYSVGAGGAGGVSSLSGGNGGSGIIIVTENYAATTNTFVNPNMSGTPPLTIYTSGSGTYMVPNGTAYLTVEMVGGGGGGGGNPSATGGNGSASTFGSSLLSAGGGNGGGQGSAGPAGGSASCGSVSTCVAVVGGSTTAGTAATGGDTGGTAGGSSVFGGAGGGGSALFSGENAAANSGSGGGGAGDYLVGTYSGTGGSSGGYVKAIITGPLSSYPYSVGTGGTGGSASTSGGNGAAGIILITAHPAQNAPVMVGSLTTQSSGATQTINANITDSGSTPVIVSQSGGLSSPTFISTGVYSFAMSGFTITPTCVCNDSVISDSDYLCNAQPQSSTLLNVTIRHSGVSADDNFGLICVGPH